MADISMSFFSKMMGRHVTVKIMLPFDTAEMFGFTEPYRTVYFLPGYSANAQSMVSQLIMAEECAMKGFAAVIPDGENSFYVDQPDIQAYYERFVAEELVEVTRKLFPLSHRREDTYIGGISMGGFGSLMLGCRHMDTFSRIIAMSPAIDMYPLVGMGFTREQMDRYFKDENYFRENYHPLYLLKKAKEEGKQLPDIYVCCGTEDPLTYQMDCEFAEGVKELGIPITFRTGSGSHETKFWNRWIPEAIDFALK